MGQLQPQNARTALRQHGIAGKIEIELEGVRQRPHCQHRAGVGAHIAPHAVCQNGQQVCHAHFGQQTLRHQHKARNGPVCVKAARCLQLRQKAARPRDGPGGDEAKKACEQAKVHRALRHGARFPVYVYGTANGLQGEKADAKRQHQRKALRRGGKAQGLQRLQRALRHGQPGQGGAQRLQAHQQAKVQPHGKPQPAPARAACSARHPAHGGIGGQAVQNQHRQPHRRGKGIEQPACRQKNGILIFFRHKEISPRTKGEKCKEGECVEAQSTVPLFFRMFCARRSPRPGSWHKILLQL